MIKIQGQDRAVAFLQRSMGVGRLASTWLFAGPQGVGKFGLAVELAKTVMCDSPVREKNGGRVKGLGEEFELTLACGVCESCRAVAARNHPDLHVITKELIRFHDKGGKSKGTTLSIDVIRGEITGDSQEGKEAKIYKRSFRGKGKFFIIDEAELMEAPAQNSLLKTLEEPPAESYLILVTTSPGELLSTIRSRSQVIEFGGLPEGVVMKGLVEAGMGGEDAALLARLAKGSLGKALRWVEDIRKIDAVNGKAAERAAKAGGGEEDEEEGAANKFTPGGILTWTRELAGILQQLVSGQASASEVAGVIAKYAAEYSGLALVRDKLTSADRAKRDGIGLLLGIAGEWFGDRMRFGLGVTREMVLPSTEGAMEAHVAGQLIAGARAAEGEIDMNANEKILLAAVTNGWERVLSE